MKIANNIIGIKYTKLIVLRRLPNDYRNKPLWECQCDCGQIIVTLGERLASGKTKSCGCLRKKAISIVNKNKTRMNIQEKAINFIYSTYKKSARNRKLKFQLSIAELSNLIQNNCFYCSEAPSNTYKDKKKQIFKYNGIDRVDSSLGYISQNVVTACANCNYAKSDLSLKEFINWIKKVNNTCPLLK